ncbi:hypothetical protein PSTG_16108 [Puccinia striiformis f. sp. tritici PST-78]|uniref:PAS domain-containing protein n=1 Tax=Puccinia striiformis f. sp. tritici PST-78 TaxID=1165861 RepID=A0A0L0UU24_9BASI|nr:hypothetical protein PSTG_16108 [Puccinia striiformis f. sp. tritici PST-78]
MAIGASDEDDYQQRIDPALRSYHFPTSLRTPPQTPIATSKLPAGHNPQQESRFSASGEDGGGHPSTTNNQSYNQKEPTHMAHDDFRYAIHPFKNTPPTQAKLKRSTSSSSASSSPASSYGSQLPNFLSTSYSTASIPEFLSAHRLRPGHSPSLQDLNSSLNNYHPIPISYLQNPNKSPASISTGKQTGTTSTSQGSTREKSLNSYHNNSIKDRLDFGEQWLINQHHPSEEDAKPIDKISAELDYSFKRLINLDVFRQLLEDPTSRHAFRQAIILGLSSSSSPSSPSSSAASSGPLNPALAKLDLWTDCRGISQILSLLKLGVNGLSDIYLKDPDSRNGLNEILSDSVSSNGGATTRLSNSINRLQVLSNEDQENDDTVTVDYDEFDDEEEETHEQDRRPSYGGLKAIENRLLISLYRHEFPLFLKKTLVSNVIVKLGKFNLNENDRDGLGDCFCLTNPRLRDHPIVLVSEGFTKVTGYERHSIVGKNCRFLQGPGTSPESVQRIRDGLNSGEGCTELLLNYRKDGTPFYCLLCIIPFRDVTGALIYFIGGQINVTGMLSSKKGLSFLMTNDDLHARGAKAQELSRGRGRNAGRSTDDLPSQVGLDQHSFSPNMQQYAIRGGHSAPSTSEKTSSSRDVSGAMSGNKPIAEHHAAGSIILDSFDPNFGKEQSIRRTKPFGFLRRLAGVNSREISSDLSSPHPSTSSSSSKNSSQKLLGAETLFHDPKPLTDHIKQFETTYSHLIVFQQDSRRVIFATKEVIQLFGLTSSNSKEIYKSKLIQTDFVDLIWSMTPLNKESVTNLRAHLKKTIKACLPISVDCQVKSVERGFFLSMTKDDEISKLRSTKIHLTPLIDKDGQGVAYVCLFG